MKVYIVVAGEYSDKHNVAVTFNEEEAKKMVKIHKNTYGIHYETFDTDNFPKFVTEDPIWHCTCWRDSEPIIDKMWYETADATTLNKIEQHGEGPFAYYESPIQAKDEEEAKKIFLDLVTMQQAMEGGLTT